MISAGPNLWIASFNASRQKSASSVFDIRQAKTLRVNQSMIATRQRKPRRIGRQVMSAHQTCPCLQGGPVDPQPAQQTGADLVPLRGLAGVGLSTDRQRGGSAKTARGDCFPDERTQGASAAGCAFRSHHGPRSAGATSSAGHRKTRSAETACRPVAQGRGSSRSRPAIHGKTTTARSTAGGTAPGPTAWDGFVRSSRSALPCGPMAFRCLITSRPEACAFVTRNRCRQRSPILSNQWRSWAHLTNVACRSRTVSSANSAVAAALPARSKIPAAPSGSTLAVILGPMADYGSLG